MAQFYQDAQIMTELGEYERAGRGDVLERPKHWKCLMIFSPSSEIEFLHGCEASPFLLCRAAGTQQFEASERLLPLWIEIGRPHPAILRRFLLGKECSVHVPKSLDRQRLTEFLNWSWASFNAVREFARSELARNTEDVVEKDANQQALEQVEKITESDRDKGEDLLESEELKRALREAKERLESPKPPRK